MGRRLDSYCTVSLVMMGLHFLKFFAISGGLGLGYERMRESPAAQRLLREFTRSLYHSALGLALDLPPSSVRVRPSSISITVHTNIVWFAHPRSSGVILSLSRRRLRRRRRQ